MVLYKAQNVSCIQSALGYICLIRIIELSSSAKLVDLDTILKEKGFRFRLSDQFVISNTDTNQKESGTCSAT